VARGLEPSPAVRALTLLPALRTQLTVLLVGDGELRADLQGRARELGLDCQIIFAGYRNDVPRLLSAMDGTVLSSDFEGQPFAILEAMAMSLPVIATAVAGLPKRSCTSAQDCSSRRRRGGVSARIERLMIHPDDGRQMGRLGRERFLQFYTQAHMVGATDQLYRSILSANPTEAHR
jgi:glycosyltransferase involved in cell wall biosynthesis